MGKVKLFKICLESDHDVYYPGDVVSGKCLLRLRSEMKVKTITVHLKGSARVHWTETEDSTSVLSIFTKFVNSEVVYFFAKKTLFTTENGSPDTLGKGVHEFEFHFELPHRGLSTSFEGKYGNVRYCLQGKIEKHYRITHNTKKAFTLICPIDINRSEYLLPVEREVEKAFCCLFCIRDTISMHAKTDRTGYCPGEYISISAEFQNHTRCTVMPNAALHQTQLFVSGTKFRVRNVKLTVLKGFAIRPHKTTVWGGPLLKIPPVSPSILNCHLIRIEYLVRITVHIPLIGYQCYVDLPVIIGTVPYRMSEPPPALFTGQLPYIERPVEGFLTRNLSVTLPEDNFRPHSMTPPPTYQECIDGSLDDEDDNEIFNFTPRYTYVDTPFVDQPPAYSEIEQHPTR